MKLIVIILLLSAFGCASHKSKKNVFLVEAELSIGGTVHSKPKILVLEGESASLFTHSDSKDTLLEIKVDQDGNDQFLIEASFCEDIDALDDSEIQDLSSCSKINSMVVAGKEGSDSFVSSQLKNEAVKKFKYKIKKVKKGEDIYGEFY